MYCIDTCSLSNSWTRWYPPQTFQTFWHRMEELITSGRAISVQDVLDELGGADGELTSWVKRFPDFIVEHDEESQKTLADIMSKQPTIINPYTNFSAADPSVIAIAESRSFIVVTEERRSRKDHSKEMRIPDVCLARGVACITIVELMSREGWRF